MKILIINTVPTSRSGITNVIFNYFTSIRRNNIIMDYSSLNNPENYYSDIVEKAGGKVFVLPSRTKNIFSYSYRLFQLIKQEKYDIVHIHGNSHTVSIELGAASMAGCRIRMVHAHTTTCKYAMAHKLLSPIFNFLCTHRLACGKAAGHFMFGNRPFVVVNNGVDTEKFAFCLDKRADLRKDLGWGDNRVIGHVGYFKEVKNQNFIVDIFNELYIHDNKYRLILIGDGPLRGQVEKKVLDLGLSDFVRFTGNINNVNEYLNAIDLIVMPSLFEGLPLSLIEQQANGLQCVVSDTVTKEVDKTGNLLFLQLSLTAKEWANKIVSFHDKLSRDERSKRAIESICKSGYSIQVEAGKLENYYNSIIKKR